MNGSRWSIRVGCGRLAGAAIAMLACAAASANDLEPFRISNAQLETVGWSELSGWSADDHTAAFKTFLNSCNAIVRGTPPGRAGQPFWPS